MSSWLSVGCILRPTMSPEPWKRCGRLVRGSVRTSWQQQSTTG